MEMKSVAAVFASFTLIVPLAAGPAQAQFWKRLMPASHTEVVSQSADTLSQENGPWLIMAASFRGDNAEEQAGQLADELRDRHRLATYVHDRSFDFSDERPGRGLDDYGAPIRRRYQTEKSREFAVLVGNFASIDDPEAQQTLERIKSMPSSALASDDDDAALGIDQFRQLSSKMLGTIGGKQRGPMGKAFLTRNPLLPRKYFVPQGVDNFVAKMNKGVEHSLLDCTGKYTVQVATFRGKAILQTNAAKADSSTGFSWKWRKEKTNPLIEAAVDAHLLAKELRAHGWEAYEFHDRKESIVTIGAFDRVAQRLPDGRVVPTPQVQKIIRTFGAAYDTPADALTGDDIRTQRRAKDLKLQFNQMLSNNRGQITPGMNPKHVKIMRRGKVERIIPIDIYPHTVEVPQRSISSAYSTR